MDKMIRILSTGDMENSDLQYAGIHDIEVDIIPFIEIEELPFCSDFIRRLAIGKQTVVFTSKQAVQIVSRALDFLPAWDIYCIEGKTKSEVEKWLPSTVIKATALNGTELADLITKDPGISEVTFFCGEQRLDVIPEQLRKNGILLHELYVYRTLPLAHIVNVKYDAIFFYSPSGVRSFFSVNDPEDAVLFSIGETTTAALYKYIHNKKKVLTSSLPDKAEMLRMAVAWFQ